jgi:hypothetical protein
VCIILWVASNVYLGVAEGAVGDGQQAHGAQQAFHRCGHLSAPTTTQEREETQGPKSEAECFERRGGGFSRRVWAGGSGLFRGRCAPHLAWGQEAPELRREHERLPRREVPAQSVLLYTVRAPVTWATLSRARELHMCTDCTHSQVQPKECFRGPLWF